MSSRRTPPPTTERPRTFGRRAALSLAGAAFASCRHAPTTSQLAPPRAPLVQRDSLPVVVLLAIDGARWQDIYRGPTGRGAKVAVDRDELIPHLVSMERAGVTWGAPQASEFHASGPNFVSLPGYMEMLSGTSATSCTENDCQTMKRTTLLDDFQALAPHDPTRAGAFSSWPKIEVAASQRESGVVSAGRWKGFRHDVLEALPRCRVALQAGQGPEGGEGEFRSDAVTARLARAFLAEASPEFMFVSLGESDEEAHRGNYPGYLRALQFADSFVGQIRSDLARLREQGRDTVLLVTTDHGRGHNFNDHGRRHPESSRGFLFAEGGPIRRLGPVRGGPAYLKDIAPTIREMSALPTKGGVGYGRVLREILA